MPMTPKFRQVLLAFALIGSARAFRVDSGSAIRSTNRAWRRPPPRRVETVRRVAEVASFPSLTTSYEFTGSYASLYATLGLYVLSFPGLYSLIKRSTKVQLVQKTFVFDDDGREMREIAGEVMAYMRANNYAVAEAADTITFKGVVESSKSQAFFLSFCAFVGLASLALVLQIQLPQIGSYWFLMILLSPYAGIYYWQNASQDNEFKIKLEERDEPQAKALVVRGGKEDVERMARVCTHMSAW
ncbi:hypothetical protein CTAYLR_003415 [Chrysophaeum taylorii]|uniref:Uncharacterized protein n=1 Tax=Chrysophaeum taylorii TaxID=2483200 RepID=A0AAD7U9Z3_9STRA|nr:hypothetical protein CTAYLR_003415 [Chrysophaeum taylorii]